MPIKAKLGKGPAITVAPSQSPSALQRPETYRLPKAGGDRFFGFSRSMYFLGEKRGYWKLIRICEPGKSRGVTLIPYREVAAFIAKQRKQHNGGEGK